MTKNAETNGSAKAAGRQAAAQSAAPDPKPAAAAESGVPRTKRFMRRALLCAALPGGWIAAAKVGVIDPYLFKEGSLVVAVLLFFAGLPLSFYFRIDNTGQEYGLVTEEQKLMLALAVAIANIALWTFVFGVIIERYRRWKDSMKAQSAARDAERRASRPALSSGTDRGSRAGKGPRPRGK